MLTWHIVIGMGLVPLIFVSATTSPFATYVHLRLPNFARLSRENLERYSKSLPKDAILDITTMNVVGKPRVSRLEVCQLRPVQRRFSLANYTRTIPASATKRPWYASRPIREFAILDGVKGVKDSGIWENVARCIQRLEEKSKR
jgi:hypothetical protein